MRMMKWLLFLTLCSTMLSQAALGEPPLPAWEPTGSMALDRMLHTAMLLPGGKVLVVGGFNQTAELYDPATGTWAPTSSALTSRRYHTATLLPGGRVLLAGGEGAESDTTAELYDPATSTWAPTGSMVTLRSSHAAALLPSGKVLVMGGVDDAGSTLSSAELYDPATGTWTLTGFMATARSHHTATLLPGGKVLVAGGGNSASSSLDSAEVYDPATGTWTTVGSMGSGRRYHTATQLSSGKVLVVGGDNSAESSISTELYDPATGSWSATGSMGGPRRYHTANLLNSGKVLVAGGYHEFTGIHNSAELYDPTTGTWSPTVDMNVDRYFHTATLLSNGRVLTVGGVSNTSRASAEIYLPPNSPPVMVSAYQSSSQFGASERLTFRMVASDPDAHPLSFTWSASAGTLGTPVSSESTSEVAWTAPSPACSSVTLQVVVKDPYGASFVYTFTAAPRPGACRPELSCSGAGLVHVIPDGCMHDGGYSAVGDSLEVYCFNGIARFCLSGEGCPWRRSLPSADDGQTCSLSGLSSDYMANAWCSYWNGRPNYYCNSSGQIYFP
ncbi:Kelch repeat-containing protein [Archangium sp.]|uniref:Kelch repeat-containing protein n=1 Tax=Archangium sp. TaxID=1872627 RepID=UPI002D696C83|nr:kelch repeat-containing protein [Archangium sp.]HYO59554.1 kelch repeat-containing protein [Archangium sp.]